MEKSIPKLLKESSDMIVVDVIQGIKIIQLKKVTLTPEEILKAKRILVLGETGCGKSTLINSFTNYFHQVKLTDTFRYKAVIESNSNQTESITKDITEYHYRLPDGLPVIIVDTPGLGDTKGIEADKKMLKNFFQYLKTKSPTLDAICFVIKSSTTRLTHFQKYVIFNVLKAFGNDVKENVFYFFTFSSDGKKTPIAIQVIQECNLPLNKSFNFNNSALYPSNEDEYNIEDIFLKRYWDLYEKNVSEFFKHFLKIKPATILQTAKVIELREMLEICMEKLLKDIDEDLVQLQNLNELEKVINEAFGKPGSAQKVTVQKIVAEKIKKNVSHPTTCCLTCDFTCHIVCDIEQDEDKETCLAIGKHGLCKICPNKCHWSVHKNSKYIIETENKVVEEEILIENEKKNDKSDEEIYKDLSSKKARLDKIKQDLKKIRSNLLTHVVQAKSCLDDLQKIALRPTSGDFDEYIDQLILNEETKMKPGYENRKKELERLKSETKILEKLKNQNHDAFINENFDGATKTLNNIEKDLQSKIDELDL